jgi:hypothetical protein
VGALRSLLEQVPLVVDVPELLTHWRWFGEWSLGCIGVLSDWLVETVDTLFQEGATTLTIEALTRHALQPDQRVRMEMEARTGEHKVDRAKQESEQELKRLLGDQALPPTTASANLSTRAALEVLVSSSTPGGASLHTRIERAAARDPVGDQVHAVATPKCSFPGVVSIEPKRFLDSSVRLVECPECGRMRSLDLSGSGVLRFPSHERRKTRPRIPSDDGLEEKRPGK